MTTTAIQRADSLPIAEHLGDTEHLRVHAMRCAPTHAVTARIVVTAFPTDPEYRPPITCVLKESIGVAWPGWIDSISPRNRYHDELLAFLAEKFGPLSVED